jgi:biopolymer transport protein ExbD
MRRRALRLHTDEEPSINLTPLIDVVFVILIMFIVIAPLLELDRIDLADGAFERGDSSIAVQENSPISIHVFPDNSVKVNNTPVDLADLAAVLSEAKARFPGVRPQLFHDRRAHFGTYQTIKNTAESVGFQQIDIILKPG